VPSILKLGTPDAPRAIIVVTAHWSAERPTISSSDHHSLYYDYGGFPREAYNLKYDAPGSPSIAEEVRQALQGEGFDPVMNTKRGKLATLQQHERQDITGNSTYQNYVGWDHGVFIPLLLVNPAADIPVVQLSVLESEDPTQHHKMGRAIAKLRDNGVAIIGSGFASFHNLSKMGQLFMGDRSAAATLAKNVKEWNEVLTDAATKEKREDRRAALDKWRDFPHAYLTHPPGGGEHFMPLLVCAGAAADEIAGKYKDNFLGIDIWTYFWGGTLL
jgi:aromatic ring-opening dioxygenase catalytic subunit (LigB family)